jgi:hypothetical protein
MSQLLLTREANINKVVLQEPKIPKTGHAPLMKYTQDVIHIEMLEMNEVLGSHGTMPARTKTQLLERLPDKPEKKPTKGYELFNRAIELGITQVRGYLGNAKQDKACAIGAMYYVLTDGKRVNAGIFGTGFFINDNDYLVETVRRKVREQIGVDIETLNDRRNWSFERFRDFCLQHDI